MRRLSSILFATVLLALSAGVASADGLLADGDGIAPVANGRLNLGTICHGSPTTATALLAVRATSHPNGRQVFDNGALVTTAATVESGDGLAVGSAAPSLVMAADWRSQPNGTLSDPVEWQVTLTPTALGRYRGRIEFSATGLNRRGEVIERTRRMNVVARVNDCAAPVLRDVPADMVVEAEAADGADVTYQPPTATDAVDGAVDVACDVPTTGRLPIGTTSVSCSAEDDAGNVATAAFDITVVDSTAPALTSVPGDITVTAGEDGLAVVDWPMPTATDLVDGPVSVSCDPAPGTTFTVGVTTVTCSAQDMAGNVAAATFAVDVSAPARPEPEPQPAPEPESASDPTPGESEPPLVPDEEPATTPEEPVAEPAQETANGTGGPPRGAILPDTGLGAPGPTGLQVLGSALLGIAALSAAAGRSRRGA